MATLAFDLLARGIRWFTEASSVVERFNPWERPVASAPNTPPPVARDAACDPPQDRRSDPAHRPACP